MRRIKPYVLKVLRYILYSLLFIIYIHQPAFASSLNVAMEMACCSDSKIENDEQNMPCCEEDSGKVSCEMDSCCCSGLSITASTLSFQKELRLLHRTLSSSYPILSLEVQTPFLSIWCPPDIA